jgi:glutathione S-transferase
MLQIYGRDNSINVRKVLWLCAEADIPYTRYDFGRGFKGTDTPEFTKVSRFGVVPVIDDDGFVLRESQAIVRYLCSKNGRTDLYPTDLKQRALVEAWMDWGCTDFANPLRDVFWGVQLKHPDFSDPKRIARGIEQWSAQMSRLDAHLALSGPYLMGGAFTIADIPVGLGINRWYAIDFQKPTFTRVQAYYDTLGERPAYRKHGRNGVP